MPVRSFCRAPRCLTPVAAVALFTFAELAGAQTASHLASESVGTLDALTVEGTAVETAIAGERATG